MNAILQGAAPWRPAAMLRVTGEDALAFLQGQFTQELRPTSGAPVQYGLWLNQKGRVLADSQVLRLDAQEWWIVSQESPAGTIRERLEAYIIADDVTIEDHTDEWHGLVLAGDLARAWIEREVGRAPEPGEWRSFGGGFLFAGRRGAGRSWEWLTPAAPATPPRLESLTAEELERARIAAVLPAVPRDLGPGDLPAEGGLEDTAISYTKGCYLGQEVMARLKAMGRVRRRLLGVAGSGAAPATPAPVWQNGKTVGELRSTVSDGREGWLGLAMLSLVAVEAAAPLALSEHGAPAISVRARPEGS